MKSTIGMMTMVAALTAGWLGLCGWVVSDLSTAKASIDTVAMNSARPAPAVESSAVLCLQK